MDVQKHTQAMSLAQLDDPVKLIQAAIEATDKRLIWDKEPVSYRESHSVYSGGRDLKDQFSSNPCGPVPSQLPAKL